MAQRVRSAGVVGAVLALSLSMLLTGCGSDQAAEPAATPSAESSVASSAPAEASESASPKTASSPPTSAPADSSASSAVAGSGETAPVALDQLPTDAEPEAFCQAYVDSMPTSGAELVDPAVQAQVNRDYAARLVELGATPEMTEAERAGMVVFINLVRAQPTKGAAQGQPAPMSKEQTTQFTAFAQYRSKVCQKQLEALTEELNKP